MPDADTPALQPLPSAASAALGRTGGVAIAHGFYGSRGGVSGGDYDSLNAGPGSADDPANVAENRARIAADIGATSPAHLISLHQIHSAVAVTLTSAPEDRPEADAMVTTMPGLALCILTADCVPVLFADAEAGVIGAAHAGWKGALTGVLDACVDEMEAAGARRSAITAAIGPCIHQPSYEVGPEFRDTFEAVATSNTRFFTRGQGDRLHFDLPGYAAHRLATGCGLSSIETIAHDTCALEGQYFSNRRRHLRGEADYGRNASVIMLRP